ncbi:retrotransposon protein, putative, ty1-copia subclass [Tanacetum coccineum]
MASTRASISKVSKRPKINIIPPKQLFVDLTQDDTKTPSPKLPISSPSAPNAPSKTPSTKDTSSSSIDYIPKSPTSSTSLSPNGYLNPPTSPPPRVSPPPPTQENASMDITLTLSPITPLDVQFDTPSPSPPIIEHPIPWNLLEAHGYPKETMGYYVYYPLENKIFFRNDEFFENSFMVQEASGSHGLLEMNRYGYYVDVEEYELRDLDEPPNYKAALADPESDKWLEAMNTKMQSMKDNQVWILVELPPNARLVAKGYTQTYGVDYGETFYPVAYIRAIRILLAIVAFYDYEIWQMDVKTTFLNSYLSEDVYMVQPKGFVDPKHPNKVCKLQRSIYGLKQASRSWNKRFDEEIKKIGFTQNPDESCVYLKASGSNVAFLVLYVDDILLMGNSVAMLQEVKSWLCKCFYMKDLGEVAYILGIKIIRDRSKRLIALSQSVYLEKILKKFRMENSKKRKSQGAKTPTEVQRMLRVPYASAIGSIMYAMRKFIDGLGGVMPSNKRPMEMLCDNEPALAITGDPRILKGARHFQRKYHYIREVIQRGEIVLKKVHTNDNVAGPFTKPMIQ